MLLVAFSLEDGRDLPQPEVWALLSTATGTALVGASLIAAFVRGKYRHTFYKVGKLQGRHRVEAMQYRYRRFTTRPNAHDPPTEQLIQKPPWLDVVGAHQMLTR